MSGNYKVNVMQSDLPSIYLNLTPTDTETAEQLLNKINADRNHDIGFPGVAYIRDSEDNLTTASFKKMKGRGNATWTYSKRPYQVKFDKSISMFFSILRASLFLFTESDAIELCLKLSFGIKGNCISDISSANSPE